MSRVPGNRLVSDLALVGVAAFTMNAGLTASMAIYSNFLVNDLHIGAQSLGFLESLREVPSFLTVAMAAVTVQFRASRLAQPAVAANWPVVSGEYVAPD